MINQLTICNILNSQNDLGTPEIRAAVASMIEKKKDYVLVFLKYNTEELYGLPDGCCVQARQIPVHCCLPSYTGVKKYRNI